MKIAAGTGEVRWLEVSDGRRLAWRYWPAEHCRGIVVAVHGIQSHSGWYAYSSQQLSAAGFSVCFADRRGSGLNGRERGHARHGMQLVNDLRMLCAEVLSEHPHGTPLHLLGLSWGGRIAAAAAALFPNEFSSLVLLYPGLFPLITPTWFQRLQLKLARHLEIVRHHIPIPLAEPALFTDDPAFQDFIADDPLALHTVSSSLLNAGRDLDEILQSGLSQFHAPTLVMLAANDQIIDNTATRNWLQKQALPNLKITEWPDAQHTLEFAANRDEIFKSLISWLSTQRCDFDARVLSK